MVLRDGERVDERGEASRPEPDLAWLHQELRRPGVTLELLHLEYLAAHPTGYRYQMLAMLGWTSLPWLWRIRHPTLVLAGSDDPLVPLVNARLHTRLLHDARLHVLDDGHLFLLTRAQETASVLANFLAETRS